MKDIQQIVTDKIVAALEAGVDRWQRPWIGRQCEGRPYNAVSGKPYRGVNTVILWMAGYDSAEWATYRQWAAKGAQVRAGEKGTMVVYYGTAPSKKPAPTEGAGESEGTDKSYRFLKSYFVFNAAQVEGYVAVPFVLPALAERLQAAEAFVDASGAVISYGGNRAYYVPSADMIRVPTAEQFLPGRVGTATEAYYGTLLHELVHWTGAQKRCDRQLTTRFGDEAYAVEELVAEIGAAFLCSSLGISAEPRSDHASYLASWLKVLKSDKRAIFTAAAKAAQAQDFLEALQPGAGAADEPAEADGEPALALAA